MNRSFKLYICLSLLLSFLGFGCQKIHNLRPTDILFEFQNFKRLNGKNEEFKPGDLGCLNSGCYMRVKAEAICNCLVRNTANEWICQGSTDPKCHLTSPDCFCWFKLTPPYQYESEVKSLVLDNLYCDPGEDPTQWQLDILECRRNETLYLWLRQPEKDEGCFELLKKLKEKKEENK